ncbi:MAG: hypothetical protein JXB19_03755 [Bacteroidales bacterium]|nr:hypothetical protein [Bacteroidales bacterium]
MESKSLFFFVLIVTSTLACSKSGPLQAEIRNEHITAQLLLPDEQTGYYRGTRFDWSGIISDLEYEGHHFFGKWFEEYSPTLHDAIMGPVEEFAPLGYDEANPGGSFVKIGVGVLQKPPADSVYNRFSLYPIEDHGTWKVNKKSDKIAFTQELNDTEYSYEYTKTISLIRGKPEMKISHILKNTGKRVIETNVYNHNFFVIDNQPTGTGFVVTFPFTIVADTGKIGEIKEIHYNKISFRRDLLRGETVRLGTITGYSNDIKDFDITLENSKTGAGVRIKGDRPLSRILFWASLKTLCPETYININIEPGQEFIWAIFYEFYTINHHGS